MPEKIYSPVDVKQALQERLKKFEIQLRDLHARELKKDEHFEPGVHESDMGQHQHLEGGPGPGGHESAAMSMPASQPEQPVGSSSGIPPGQLQDLCPMCGQPDAPGQCTCLNGGGHEALDPGIIDPASVGVPATPLNLSEKSMASEGLCKEHSAKMCKACGLEKAVDFVDIKGEKKTLGVVGSLPDDKKSKEVSAEGGGGDAKKAKGLTKAGPPMAKPPGGGPASGVAPAPVASAKAPKVGGPPGGTKTLGKAASPMAVHAAVDAFKAKGAGVSAAPKPMPNAATQASRAASFGSAMAGDFQPKGPINSGLELASKPKMAAPGRLAVKKNELSKSMGVCLFCGNSEHNGNCGLAKNIQSSLAKVASPILQAIPKLKAGGVGHPGHISRGVQPKTKVDAPPGDPTLATPLRAPSKMADPKRIVVKGEESASVEKAVDKIVVHGTDKLNPAPKGADYEARQEGSKSIYVSKPKEKKKK